MNINSVYLAARFSKQKEMRQHRELFQKAGIFVTSKWLDQATVENLGADEALDAKHAVQDLVDIRIADGLVFFAEPELARRGGRHVEFGYALALGKPIYVVGPHENVFHFVPGIKHFESVPEVILELRGAVN